MFNNTDYRQSSIAAAKEGVLGRRWEERACILSKMRAGLAYYLQTISCHVQRPRYPEDSSCLLRCLPGGTEQKSFDPDCTPPFELEFEANNGAELDRLE